MTKRTTEIHHQKNYQMDHHVDYQMDDHVEYQMDSPILMDNFVSSVCVLRLAFGVFFLRRWAGERATKAA